MNTDRSLWYIMELFAAKVDATSYRHVTPVLSNHDVNVTTRLISYPLEALVVSTCLNSKRQLRIRNQKVTTPVNRH
jgi:hypothetical protein